jgi:hypothetical protein
MASQNVDPDVERALAREAPRKAPGLGKRTKAAKLPRQDKNQGSLSDSSDLPELTESEDEGQRPVKGGGAYSHTM